MCSPWCFAVDNADHAPPHRRPRKNNAPGIRFDMTRRPSSCAGLLEESASRTQKFACALERSSRRQRLSMTMQAEEVSSDDWKFPETAGLGEYLVPIYLGTPPQKASIVIDTGSDLTWIQSEPCISCFPQVDPIFDPSKSSTYKRVACATSLCEDLVGHQCSTNNSCIYAYTYGDGSKTEGFFSTESITVERTSGEKIAVPNFPYGASFYTSDSFAAIKGEGVLGLGRGKVSLPTQLGTHFGHKFSYCLVDWLSNGSVTSTMYFGDAAVPTGEVMYTPMVFNSFSPSLYYIRVVGISVGASRLSIDQSVFEIDSSGGGGTIIDSGTTITYMQWEAFPTMEIHLDGAHLRLPTSNTFLSFEANITCLTFISAEGFPIGIMGNILQYETALLYTLSPTHHVHHPEQDPACKINRFK